MEFIGENNIIKDFEILVIYKSNNSYIKLLLNKLVKLEKYELLIKILDLLILDDYGGNRKVIMIMLPLIKTAIELNNNEILIKYINIVNTILDPKLGRNSKLNMVDKLIKEAEQDKV